MGREPEGEDYDGGEGVNYDHGIETAEAVGDDAGQDTTENAGICVSETLALLKRELIRE